MDPIVFLLGSIAVMAAGMVQVLTGFGFALVSIPLLMFLFPGYEAVLIGMVLSILILFLQARKDWKKARWDLVGLLTAVGLLGLCVGLLGSDRLHAVHLKSIVGASVLVYIVVQWIQNERERRTAKVEQAATSDSPTELSASRKAEKKKVPRGFYIAGMFSGLLTGVVGMPGPPVVAVLINFLKKDTFRATLVNYFLINYVLAFLLAFFVVHKENQADVLIAVGGLIIPTFIGYLLGHPLRKYINDENFKRLVFLMLIIIGITSIWQAAASL
ncbi:sulfite exporter TauE/SafE family protein [Bacillus piscicola]|uniref:sulfite exporter TauE/SafE family protein n=1 Tax=Bacillus piscicola TaxID=1632684 RepID=UPI001F093F62|nr:sulfite exporter TauE/SafE family protein [Bacillus piscicola]